MYFFNYNKFNYFYFFHIIPTNKNMMYYEKGRIPYILLSYRFPFVDSIISTKSKYFF